MEPDCPNPCLNAAEVLGRVRASVTALSALAGGAEGTHSSASSDNNLRLVETLSLVGGATFCFFTDNEEAAATSAVEFFFVETTDEARRADFDVVTAVTSAAEAEAAVAVATRGRLGRITPGRRLLEDRFSGSRSASWLVLWLVPAVLVLVHLLVLLVDRVLPALLTVATVVLRELELCVAGYTCTCTEGEKHFIDNDIAKRASAHAPSCPRLCFQARFCSFPAAR
jgi:hypothetical protein